MEILCPALSHTPLSFSAEEVKAVLELLRAKILTAESKVKNDRTLLSYAAANAHEAVVKLLLKNGYKAHSKDEDS